jgi:serine/threonine protein phosphatase PrpC
VRHINQDNVFALVTALPREATDIPLGLFVVADGMGGHEGGEVASRLAVASVVRHVLGQLVLPALEDEPMETLQSLMTAAVEDANRTIWNQAQAIGSDMGTTCTAVLLLGSALYIGHVGDSRCYILEPGGLQQLTSDHSAVGRLIQVGQLAPSEAREHPLRNQLYRTVGQNPHVLVDFIHHPIGAGTHLLLGSDGLWGMIDEAEMEQVLRAHRWPQDICHALIAGANHAGGEDNISAVVVTLPVVERDPA